MPLCATLFVNQLQHRSCAHGADNPQEQPTPRLSALLSASSEHQSCASIVFFFAGLMLFVHEGTTSPYSCGKPYFVLQTKKKTRGEDVSVKKKKSGNLGNPGITRVETKWHAPILVADGFPPLPDPDFSRPPPPPPASLLLPSSSSVPMCPGLALKSLQSKPPYRWGRGSELALKFHLT